MKVVFSVYDSAAKFYSDPFFALTKGQALRDFVTACNDPKTYLNQHPSDYTLFELGSFDELTGNFSMHLTPVSLGKAVEFIDYGKTRDTLTKGSLTGVDMPINSVSGSAEQIMC